MITDRRAFLKSSVAAASALGLGAPRLAAAESRTIEPAPKPLSMLILGGTGFTGPEQVAYALARGHTLTLLNRNRTRPDLFKGKVELLVGDLNGDISALKGRKFDVVIDNPTTAPAWVRNAAQYLKGNTGHYIFISTISVYADNSTPGADETAALTRIPDGIDPYTTEPTHRGRYYGALKAYAESEVAKHYAGLATIIRPGLIVGPLDPTDRFTYWPYRIDKGGDVLAPGHPTDPVQFIDARDLAEWTIRVAEQRVIGTYNAMGPAAPLTLAEMLYGIKAVTTAGTQFTWVPADFLASQGVRPWRHMPVWMPPEGATAGFMLRDAARAVARGLTFRPLAVTAKETLDWNKTRPEAQLQTLAAGAGSGGIPASKEAAVLAAWKGRPR